MDDGATNLYIGNLGSGGQVWGIPDMSNWKALIDTELDLINRYLETEVWNSLEIGLEIKLQLNKFPFCAGHETLI